MGEQGKYHGQRLKAREVLRLYAAGERDFRGTILRGCNFRGVDLSGADFSGADIRSARFVEAMLRGANFCHAQAGLQRHFWFGQVITVLAISVIAGLMQGFVGGSIGLLLVESDLGGVLVGILGLIGVASAFFAIAYQGFTINALGSVAVLTICAFAIAFSGSVAQVLAFAFYIGGFTTVTTAVAFTFASFLTGVGAIAYIVIAAGAVAYAIVAASAVNANITFAVTGASASTSASLLFLAYINRCVHIFDSKFEKLRIIGLFFASIYGTTFSGADLTGATFAHARLKSTNFADARQHPTTLTHVRWHHTQKLDRTRFGSSILQDHRVRNLLTTLNGVEQDFSHANLRGANLADANLHRANLKSANLNGAILCGAELQGVTLTEASCLETDFIRADLTGACVEAWNIDSTTCLEGVHCDFIFLRRNEEERRPSSGVFQPGEFTKLFQEVLSTIDLIFQHGVDWQAFTRTFSEVQAQHEAAGLSVQSIANKGDGVVVVKLNAAPDADKSAIHQASMEVYQVALKEAEARYKAQLSAKDDQIAIYREQSAKMEGIVEILANRPINVDVKATAESKSMQGNDYSRNVSIGGDFNATNSNVTLNLGEISGQVSNQINQLPDGAPEPGKPSLKALLTQLQAAIEADKELSDIEKKEAFGEVAKLAEAGSAPQANAMQRVARRAADNLKSIAEPLTEASNLAEACKNLLPLILPLFALL
ncbi:MAG: pentapeptide repeat-containing protein [Cyanobacteria bacterium J06638_22]